MPVKITVIHGGKFSGGYGVTGLFLHFSNSGNARTLAYVCPAARQCPPSVASLLDKQQLIPDEHCCAYVDLWRGVSKLA